MSIIIWYGRWNHETTFLALAVAVSTAVSANAATVTIGTDQGLVSPGRDNQGWWTASVVNGNPNNDNYIVGTFAGVDYRN
jgi:Tfp pilus assembly protein FimT